MVGLIQNSKPSIGKWFKNLQATVGGAIVDNDQFYIRIGLVENTINTLPQMLLRIKAWHDDRDE